MSTSKPRERLHEAALRLFAERGFHGTGIRDLAGAAGMSSATLYHYMGSKEDLLAAIMRASLERLLEAAQEALRTDDDPVEQLCTLVRLHVREHATGGLRTTVVDGEIRALGGPLLREVLALRDEYDAIWQAVLDTGCASSAWKVTDPRLARIALLEMCSGVSRWYSEGGRLDLDTLTERYVEMALGLVGA